MNLNRKQSDQQINSRQLYKTLAVVALPIALQNLIASSLSLIDNLMVGSLGEAELAAVGLSTQIFSIQWMVLFGFCSGCATFMAQFWGTRDIANIRRVVGFALTVCMSCSSLFFIAAFFFPERVLSIFTDIPEAIEMGKDYVRMAAPVFFCTSITVPFTTALRATQQTSKPLVISSTAFITNTVLNYILIFGSFGAPAMGIVGAALATLLARMLETTLVLTTVFGGHNILKGALREFFSYHILFAKRIIQNALPTTVNETLWGIATAAYNAAYGRIGITAYAAVQASHTIHNMFTMAFYSMGDAMLILVGQQLGQKHMDYAYALTKRLYRIAILIAGIGGLILVLVSPTIVGFFDFSPEGRTYAIRILTIYGLFSWLELFDGISVTGCLRAGGDTRFSMITEVSTMWLIGVPLVFLGCLYWKLPVYMVVLISQAELIVKGIILFRRFLSKKWLNNVITDIDPAS